jgi:hypothetical protein
MPDDRLSQDETEEKGKSYKNEIEYFTADSLPYGASYGHWTVRWWRWWFSIARNRNPASDTTGIYANEKQSKPTWFLAGTWVSEDRNHPRRKCSIPSGVSILFPIINCEENPLEYPDLKSPDTLTQEIAMRERLKADMDTVKEKECSVNGQKIFPEFVKSDPEFFEINLRSDMAENKKGGDTIMTASGYWVFLKPLPKGNYHINFEGSYMNGKLYSGAIYDISIKYNR